MSESDQLVNDRRRTLRWIAAATSTAFFHRVSIANTYKITAFEPIDGGYGTDPDLKRAIIPWPRIMNSRHLGVTSAVADLILPASISGPAPSAVGVPDFIDEWISAPYPIQKADRAVILYGLEWLDAEAQEQGQQSFVDLDSERQQAVFGTIVPKKGASVPTLQQKFFLRFRNLVVGAYYTTSAGFADIGYIGNVPLTEYPPISMQERTILDEELTKLGI